MGGFAEIKHWSRRTKRDIEKYGWWIVLPTVIGPLLWGLVEHRFYEWGNHLIDDHIHWTALRPVILALQTGSFFRPITLAIEIFLFGIFLILAHAYWVTRNQIAPQIDMRISWIVPKAKLGKGITDLFIGATLELREPREVEISNFELQLIRDGITIDVKMVDDIEKWVRVVDTANGYTRFLMSTLQRHLKQRGNPVEGWLHFSFNPPQIESSVHRSTLRLKANTENGTCKVEIENPGVFPDSHTKGMIMPKDSDFVKYVTPIT